MFLIGMTDIDKHQDFMQIGKQKRFIIDAPESKLLKDSVSV
jgi:hypothetical protein